jgi:teichuronic acid exporter
MTGITNQAKSGMFWSFMIGGGTQIINFLVTIILGRILAPEQFGLIGMIAIFIEISKGLIDGGFASSLIRAKDPDNLDYSTVFTVNMVTAILLYVILFLLAPEIARFYQNELLVNLIRVFGFILIINGFSIVQSTKLNKSLQFKTQFKLQFLSLIFSAIIAVWMAYHEYGVWSLVAKELVFGFLATVQLWWYAKWIPNFNFDIERFKYHFNFGYKLSLNVILSVLFTNLYNIVIGKYFSASQLGYYTRAKSLEQLPSNFFFNAVNRVFFPLLAQLKDNDEKQKEIFSILLQIVFFVVTPILIYLGIIAEPFFKFILTSKWLPTVPYFQLLVVSGIFYPIHQYNLNICKLKGRSDTVLKLSMVYNFLLFIGAFSSIWFGINGLLLSLILTNIVITFINSHFSGKLINYGTTNQITDLFPILLLNLSIAFIFFYIQVTWFYKLHNLINLILGAVFFFGVYLFTAFFLKMKVTVHLLIIINKKHNGL